MFRKVATALVIGFITYWAASDATAQGSWEGKANVPSVRRGPSAVEVDGKIYVIGGCRNPMANEEYDPAENTWRSREPLPRPKRRGMGSCAAEVGGRIYFIGGNQGPAPIRFVDLNDEYNPASNSWTSKASMPTARSGAAGAAVNGKIYVIGGTNGQVIYNVVEEYNPARNSWSTKRSMPTARAFIASAVVNDKIYVFGGHDGNNILSTVEEYDPVRNSWATKRSMPTARCWLAAAEAGGKIYVAGGNNGRSPLSTTEAYNPSSNTWTSCRSMPTARSHLAAAESGGKIYTLCGFWGETFFNTNEEFTPPESGVDEMPDWCLPRAFSLSQSYPNPFNSSTTISYEMPEKSLVTMKLYDLSGRELRTLVNSTQEAGTYRISWDAADLPSGIYYCRMEAGEYKHSIKLALIR